MDAIRPRLPVAMLIAALIAASACSSRRHESPPPAASAPPGPEPTRIGIMTGSAAQNSEDYRAAAELARRFPRRVMHITYPDNFPSESVTVAAQLSGLAGESRVHAIVIGQAIAGSVAAARTIRAQRPDVKLGFVTPREMPDSVAAVCDLAIGPDELERARVLAGAAHDMGVTNLVYYSFARQLQEPMIARQRDLLRSECQARRVKLNEVDVPDPSRGANAARDFISTDVPHQLETFGPRTGFYSTCDVLVEPLIHALVDARNGYLLEPALPAPATYATALELPIGSLPGPDSLHAAIRQRLVPIGMSGHFGGWNASCEGVALRAMGALMLDALDARADPHDSATVRRYLEAEAGSPVRMRRAVPGANQWWILLDHVVY